MGCAGCGDCPEGAWHLHVTVARYHEHSGRRVDYVSATGFGIDMRTLGYHPVSVWNAFHDDPPEVAPNDKRVRGYREHIPTQHFRGTEARATHELFVMGHRLKKMGWVPIRLKIEGDPGIVTPGRALYHEAHVKIPATLSWIRDVGLAYPVSVTNKNTILTVRDERLTEVRVRMREMREQCKHDGLVLTDESRIEVCVLDTAPELDERWLRQ